MAAKRCVSGCSSKPRRGTWSTKGVVISDVATAHAKIQNVDVANISFAVRKANGVVARLYVPMQVADLVELLDCLKGLYCRPYSSTRCEVFRLARLP